MGLLSTAEGVAGHGHKGFDGPDLAGFDEFTTIKALAVSQSRFATFITGLFNFSHLKTPLYNGALNIMDLRAASSGRQAEAL
jgi:hypothetical protein